MSDEDTQESTDSSAETPAAESQPEEQTPAEGEQGQAPEKPEAPASTGEVDKGDKSKSEDKDSKQEFKPSFRRSAAHRIQQLAKENAELKRQQQQKPNEQQREKDDAGDDEDLPPAARKRMDRMEKTIQEIQNQYNPVVSVTEKNADDLEINEFFAGKKEEQGKYEEPIREMWKLDQYRNLAASDLYKILTFDEAIQSAKAQAIEEYKKAELEAKESSASGNSSTSNRTGKAVAQMTDEELLAHNDRLKAGKA
jgi:hypothetical protein